MCLVRSPWTLSSQHRCHQLRAQQGIDGGIEKGLQKKPGGTGLLSWAVVR